jgi:hypothetical protein
MVTIALRERRTLVRPERRAGWIVFGLIIALALLIERRLPSLDILQPSRAFVHWSRTIGELQSVPIIDRAWFTYAGYLILLAPLLLWLSYRRNLSGRSLAAANAGLPNAAIDRDAAAKSRDGSPPLFVTLLVVATFCLTSWQVRWSCFFALVFAMELPALLQSIKSPRAVWIAFMLSMLPVLQEWDSRLWPGEAQLAFQLEGRREMIDLRELATAMLSSQREPFLAPWWLSPAMAYWSGQPGVAGSSHEAVAGTVDTARFYLGEDKGLAREMLQEHGVDWVIAYDSDRTAATSAAILGVSAVPSEALCSVLDRNPGQAPRFLQLVSQNGTAKLYRVANNR